MSKEKTKSKKCRKKENSFFDRAKEKILTYCSLHFIKRKKILPLSPRIIKDEYINEYLKRLHAAIKNKDIYNISVTGNYGTGKSSIIKTYLNAYNINKKDYIIINIASYFDYEETLNSTLSSEIKNDDNKKLSQNDNKEELQENQEHKVQKVEVQEDTREKSQKGTSEKYPPRKLDKNEIKLVDNIEAAILRQILFRNSAEKLKDSNIKRVSKKYRKRFDILTIIYPIYFLLLFKVVEFSENSTILTKLLHALSKYTTLNSNIIIDILFIFFIVSLANIIYMIISSLYYGIKSIKLNYNSNELIINPKEELTFSRNLREIILYFAYNKNCKLVIFEDIDRFPEDVTLKLIEELKQLNHIINHSTPVLQKITFIYTFKDSIFSTIEDKNKFYDYNISIMPVSTFYNSKEILNKLLREANVEVQPNEILKDILTEYTTDVRTFISIINDYDLFCKVLISTKSKDNSNTNADKIFAIAMIKNIEYENYEKILNHDNFIDQKLMQIEKKKKEQLDELNKELEDLEQQLETTSRNNIDSIINLKTQFWNNYVEKTFGQNSKLINNTKGRTYTRKEFINPTFDIVEIKDDDIEIINYEGDFYSFMFSEELDELSKEIDSITEQEHELEHKLNNKIKEIEEIKSLSVGQIYTMFLFDHKNSDMIDKLIANEYLDQYYVDYITLPSSSGLSSSEDKFIFGVKHQSYNINTPIVHPDKVIEELKNYFSTPYILNFNLLEYIYETNNKHMVEIAALFHKPAEEKQNFLQYLRDENLNVYHSLISTILSLKIDLWEQVKNLESSNDYKEMIYESILCEENGFTTVRDTDNFIAYSNEFFNKNRTITIERVLLNENAVANINKYMKFKIRIENISSFSPEIIIKITNLKIYKYNDNNLKKILPFVPDDLSTKAFVTTTNGRDFLQSIQENFQIFYDEYYNSHENMKINNPDIIKKVLNSSIELSAKERIYKRETFKIDINNIDKDLYEVAMKNNRIIASWGTVLTLDRKISHTVIIDWIIKNKDQLLTKHSIENNYSPTQIYYIKKVIIKLLEENVKSNEAENIYNIIHAKKPESKITNIGELNVSDKTLKQLCKWDFLEYKKPTFQRLINSDKEYAKLYLVNWLKKENSFSIYTKIKAIPGATELLLKINVISNEDKVKIIINEERNQDETEELLKISFPSNKPITIKYKNKKDKSLFYNEKYSSLFKNYKENNDEKTITFTIK